MKCFGAAIVIFKMLTFCNISKSLKVNHLTASRHTGRNYRRCFSNVYGSKLSSDTMASLKKRVLEINDMSGVDDVRKAFLPFNINGVTYGYVSQTFAYHLQNHPQIFHLISKGDGHDVIALTPALERMSLEYRSEVVGKVTKELARNGLITGMTDLTDSICSISSFRFILFKYC